MSYFKTTLSNDKIKQIANTSRELTVNFAENNEQVQAALESVLANLLLYPEAKESVQVVQDLLQRIPEKNKQTALLLKRQENEIRELMVQIESSLADKS